MAFSASTFNLLMGTLGGGPLRVWAYETTDASAVVTAEAYFTRAAGSGIKVGDIISVRQVDGAGDVIDQYELAVSVIGAGGSATAVPSLDYEYYAVPPTTHLDYGTPLVPIRSKHAPWGLQNFAGGQTERSKNPAVASWSEVALDAFSSGVTNFEFDDWEYPFREIIGPNGHPTEFIGNQSRTIRCGKGAKFIVGAELAGASGGLFRFAAEDDLDPEADEVPTLSWDGGTFQSELTETTLYGVVFIDITYMRWLVQNAVFDGGLSEITSGTIGTGFMDSAIVTHSDADGISRNNFYRGFPDTAIYPNGPGITSDLATGDNIAFKGMFTSENDTFYRCNKGINPKRGHTFTTVDRGRFLKCNIGVFGSGITLAENTGLRFNITNSLFWKIQQYPCYLSGVDARVHNNVFEDWSKMIFDDTTILQPSISQAPYAAVRLDGCYGWKVHDNTFRMKAWTGGSYDVGREPTAIVVRTLDTTTGDRPDWTSNNGVAHHNHSKDVHRFFAEKSTDCDYNRFENLELVEGASFADVIVGVNTKTYTAGVDTVAAAAASARVDTVLTIASGEITITSSMHRVDTEGAAASDDLTTINFGTGAPAIGETFTLRTASSSRDVTVVLGSNILGTANVALGTNQTTGTFRRISSTACIVI